MSQKISTRQLRQHTVLPFIGNSVDEQGDSLLSKIDAVAAKLFEDRNILLTDGGIVTFTGTSVQFTEAINLVLNQKIDGSAPQVISLGNTTRSVSASGRMIYAVIDRTAGTATITDDATTMPAVVAANQEVFLIAKRVDATDGTQRLYFRNGAAFNAGQSARLGSAGSGSGGSGTGDDLNALTFKASFTDLFDDIPTSSLSGIDTGAGKTDATLYSAVNALFQLGYDASKTATTVGTAVTMSGAPTITVKQGDMFVYGSQAKRIVTVNSQTSYVLESALTTDITTQAVCVSQAVYSKDINNFAGDGLAPSTAFSTTINQVMMVYEDTSTQGDKIFDANTAPVVGWSASSDGTNYSAVQLRPTNLSDTLDMTSLPTAGTNLYVRLFANKTSGSGTVNVLGYRIFFHRDAAAQDGTLLNQSSALLNGAGTQINIASIGVLAGKTRVKKTWSYPVGVNAGTANGALKVYINGQKIPRFVSASATPDASYTEIDATTIELDSDYSSMSLLIEIIQDVAVVDASDTNVTAISQQQEIMRNGFQSFIATDKVITPVTNVGSPAPGTFHSTVSNRAPILDLNQDLKVNMGLERLLFQGISQLQNEFGPGGEPVYAVLGDSQGLVRLVGSWVQALTILGADNFGPRIYPNTTGTDFMEITFYGTGLNALVFIDNNARPFSYSVDGGGLTAVGVTGSAVIAGRNYATLQSIQLASGLPLGVHTVKILSTATGSTPGFYGVEVVNSSTTLKVNPGVSYVSGQKLTTLAQQSPAYNSGFESGTLGTRGGRVVVYQKADGTIAKAVNPAQTLATLASTDHSNEEMVRAYDVREFGAGRSDDFSLISAAQGAHFTLDDGSTTLMATQAVMSTGSSSPLMEYMTSNGVNSYLTLTFIGTGCDILLVGNSANAGEVMNLTIDGNSIGTFSGSNLNKHQVLKLVSGLPYGTHTLRITRTAAVGFFGMHKFFVYAPKKPTVPSGAVELADYNIVADYAVQTNGLQDGTSTGVIRKSFSREMTYVGTWSSQLNSAAVSGFDAITATNGDYVEYGFFGTGVEFRFGNPATATTLTMSIDGSSNLSAYTTSFYGAGITSFTAATGVISANTTSVNGNGARVSGLPLGYHKVRVTKSTGAANFFFNAFDVITPIHSHKQTQMQYQNTLDLGSLGISDSRKITPVKESLPSQKPWSQATGITSSPTTTSTGLVTLPDMSVRLRSNGQPLEIQYSVDLTNANIGNSVNVQVYVDGVPAGVLRAVSVANASNAYTIADILTVPASPGVHKVDLYWSTSGGTATAILTRRTLKAKES